MLKHNMIQGALFEKVDNDKLSEESLKEIRKESNYLCECIEHGLFAIGRMMEHLGCFADDEAQDFSDQALDNKTVNELGGLISSNAYLLNALRSAAEEADFHLNGGFKKGGAK